MGSHTIGMTPESGSVLQGSAIAGVKTYEQLEERPVIIAFEEHVRLQTCQAIQTGSTAVSRSLVS